MSTILKTRFDWVLVGDTIKVYSDHSRFYRDTFAGNLEPITPHNAIKLLKEDKSIKIDLAMLSDDNYNFIVGILKEKNINISQII